MNLPPIVSPAEGKEAREQLLAKEEDLVRARTELAAERRRLPRVRVEKAYRFESANGPATLLDLFEGRRQLILYRFFFQPGVGNWPEGGCTGCSIFIDGVVHPAHLNARDTTFAIISPAPQPDIARYKRRMGWEAFPWYTTLDDFSEDFGVDEWFGLNVFIREGDEVFRTYFITGHPAEGLGNVWSLLELTPLGRQEEGEDSPEGYPQTPPAEWYRLHDEYDLD